MRRRHLIAAMVAASLAVASLTACSKDPGPDATLAAFAEGWPKGNLDAVGFFASTGEKMPAADVLAQITSLSGDLAKRPVKLSVAGKPKEEGDNATGVVNVEWSVADGITWKYGSTVRLAHRSDVW